MTAPRRRGTALDTVEGTAEKDLRLERAALRRLEAMSDADAFSIRRALERFAGGRHR
ncbi:MAG TPA: hypothetical protein VGC72_05710 [Candidatus Elarobacter sp.]|jgi:hypothetical protein